MSNNEIIRSYASERAVEYNLQTVCDLINAAMTQCRSASFTTVIIGSNDIVAEEINDINEELEQLYKRARDLKQKHYKEIVAPLFEQYLDTI